MASFDGLRPILVASHCQICLLANKLRSFVRAGYEDTPSGKHVLCKPCIECYERTSYPNSGCARVSYISTDHHFSGPSHRCKLPRNSGRLVVSAEREPITGVLGRSPQRGPGLELVVRKSGGAKPSEAQSK